MSGSPLEAAKGVQTHWQVVNRTYPGGQRSDGTREPTTTTEFEFGNGISIHYDPEVGGMYIYLPAREAMLSTGATTEEIPAGGQFLLNIDRTNGVPTGIEIMKGEPQ